MNRREFLELGVGGVAVLVTAGCSRIVAPILEHNKARPIYEGMGSPPENFTAAVNGDYDYSVLRLFDGQNRHVGFFTPWWQNITIPTLMAYVRQQFRGWPFRLQQFGQDQYLVTTLGRTALPEGEEGWRFVIHHHQGILTPSQWEAIALEGNFGLAVDDTVVPRHGVVDFRWGPPL